MSESRGLPIHRVTQSERIVQQKKIASTCFLYPTTNGGTQNGSSVGICTHCIHVFTCLPPIGMLSRYAQLLTKFLHQSSGGSLLRVHCWLGTTSTYINMLFCFLNTLQCPWPPPPFPSPAPPPHAISVVCKVSITGSSSPLPSPPSPPTSHEATATAATAVVFMSGSLAFAKHINISAILQLLLLRTTETVGRTRKNYTWKRQACPTNSL